MINIPELPVGRGLSYKKGVADGLLDEERFKNDIPDGHDKAYRDGLLHGQQLKEEVAKKVKT
ncbi:MAG: hypothetical protein Q7J38_07710 [Gallionella sp.]|nr:hypothetical protein [Gallionella sp.]